MNKLVEQIKSKNEPLDARFFATKEFSDTLCLVAFENNKKPLSDCIKYIGKNLDLNKATINGIQKIYFNVEDAYLKCSVNSYHETATENQTPEELKKIAQENEITKKILVFNEKYRESAKNKNHKFADLKMFK